MEVVTDMNCDSTVPKCLNPSSIISLTEVSSSRTIISQTEHHRRKNYEDFILVYLNANIQNESVYIELRKIFNYLETFENADECVDYITKVKDEKVFIIVSVASADILISILDNIRQIMSIYVLSDRAKNEQEWKKASRKVKVIAKDILSICSQLRKDKKTLRNGLLNISLLSSSPITTTDATAQIENHHREEVSAMYSNIVLDILWQFPLTNRSKQEMIEFCKEIYSDNEQQLRIIDEFKNNYTKNDAFRWYSRDTFLYRLVNKALRVHDIDALYKMRFFIGQLDGQIYEQHLYPLGSDDEDLNETMTVYRGFGMANDDFENLKSKIGGFMSITNFLSTSRDRSVAVSFAFPIVGQPDQVAIVLEIEVRVHACGAYFADLQTHSEFQDEQEILFSMGTVLRIWSITLDETGVWVVQSKLRGEKDQDLGELFPHIRLNIEKSGCALFNWATCMLEMGCYGQAEHYYLLLLQDSELIENVYELAQLYNGLGLVYKQKGENEKALQQYERALSSLRESALSTNEDSERLIVFIYINIGNFYGDQNNYEKALEYFNLAILLELKGHDPDTSKVATCYCSIGDVYQKQKRYSEALEKCEEALKMKLQVLPPHHPDIATVYHSISQIHYALQNYEKVMDLLKQTLQIRQNSLLPTHPLIAQTYDHLATTMYTQGSLKETLGYKKRAYEIRLKYLTPDHLDLFIADREWIAQVEKSIEQSNQ